MRSIGAASPVHRHVVREWQRLRFAPEALARADRWRIVTVPVRDLGQLVALTSAACPDGERERILRALVERARADELAARIVLQRLLPDLVLLHRRRSWQHWTSDVELGDLLATAWVVIRTFNPARRPARLASSLVSDVEYREYRAAHRRIGHGRAVDPLRFDEIIDEPRHDSTVELARLVRDSGHRLSDDERDLLGRLASGTPTRVIADELDVTARTVRNRRDRITGKLRAAACAEQDLLAVSAGARTG